MIYLYRMTVRADKKKNLDKVAASLAKDPLQSERQLAKNAWVSNGTAHNMKEELEQTWAVKDSRIVNLTDWDFKLMEMIQQRKFARMNDTDNPVNDSDVNNWDKEAKARYTIFRWEATDNEWGLKDVSAIDKLNDLLW